MRISGIILLLTMLFQGVSSAQCYECCTSNEFVDGAYCQPQFCECFSYFRNGCFLITADYLYWKAHEDGLEFAIDGLGEADGTPPIGQGNTKSLKWQGNSGFRVGLGYSLSCACIDMYLNYTRYKGKAHGSASMPATASTATLWGTFVSPSGGEVFFFGDADWQLCYQSLDLEIGKSFCLGNCFGFRPFGGLKGVWTTDKYDISYEDRPIINFFQTIHHKQDFCGVGPLVGINNSWVIFRDWNFFADMAYSLLWGNYNVDRLDVVNHVVTVDTGSNFSSIKSLLNFKVGVSWETCICNTLIFFIKAAFEDLIFLNHNQFVKFMNGRVGDTNNVAKGNFLRLDSNLSLYGLTLSTGINF